MKNTALSSIIGVAVILIAVILALRLLGSLLRALVIGGLLLVVVVAGFSLWRKAGGGTGSRDY